MPSKFLHISKLTYTCDQERELFTRAREIKSPSALASRNNIKKTVFKARFNKNIMSAFTSSKSFEKKKKEVFSCKSDPCISFKENISYELKKFCSMKDDEEEKETNLSFRTEKYEKIIKNFNSKFTFNLTGQDAIKTTKSYKSM